MTPCHATPNHFEKCNTGDSIPHPTVPYHSIPYYTAPYYTIPCHTRPYHTKLHHTIPNHTIPFWGMSQTGEVSQANPRPCVGLVIHASYGRLSCWWWWQQLQWCMLMMTVTMQYAYDDFHRQAYDPKPIPYVITLVSSCLIESGCLCVGQVGNHP